MDDDDEIHLLALGMNGEQAVDAEIWVKAQGLLLHSMTLLRVHCLDPPTMLVPKLSGTAHSVSAT